MPSFQISPTSLTLTVGQTATLQKTPDTPAIKFDCNTCQIASVDRETGLVTALQEGTQLLTARWGNAVQEIAVTVEAVAPPPPEPEPPPPEPPPEPTPEPPPEPPSEPSPLDPESPLAQDLHPRTYLTPTMADALRAQIVSDAAFRARWQTAVTEFEDPDGYWTQGGTNPFTVAFATILACVRRPDNDLGLTWATPGTAGWQAYRDRIVSTVQAMTQGGTYAPITWCTGMVYDLLHADLTPEERAQFSEWVTIYANQYRPPGAHWADQDADDYVARALCALAADDGATRFSSVLSGMQAWAESRSWMSFANGMGYETKEEQPTQIGPIIGLYLLKNAASLSEAETTDRYLTVVRDAWQLYRQFNVPHPVHVTSGDQWFADHVNMSGCCEFTHRQIQIAPPMIWGLAFLPGRVDSWVLPYLQHELEYPPPWQPTRPLRNILMYKYITFASATPDRPHAMGFYACVPWLLLNAQEVPASLSGVPLVRRWWPGTLDWTTVRSDLGHTTASLISYHHRKYHLASYELGCRQNGSWHAHRAGPLLVQRGETTHTPTTRFWTHFANGTITFVDTTLPENTPIGDVSAMDSGGVRPGPDGDTKAEVLANLPASDFGDVTAWFADDRVVALTSNLTRSYNSTLYAHANGGAGNEPKLSAFTRELIVIQRGADGTAREHIFTYDRLAVEGNGRFEPRYNLCPGPPQVNIDGAETPYTPWREDATGPTRWDYVDATRLILDNTVEPATSMPGEGQVCVTWLQPSGADALVRKRGGTALTNHATLTPGAPFFTQHGTPINSSGSDWRRVSGVDKRAYCGLYVVEIFHAMFTPDTRFLVVTDVLPPNETPNLGEELPCDAESVAARCGASVVVFAKEATGRSSGSVTLPSGVTLVVLANLAPGQTVALAPAAGVSVTTPERIASDGGVLTVGVGGSGLLSFE